MGDLTQLARDMLSRGQPVQFVADATGLTRKAVDALVDTMARTDIGKAALIPLRDLDAHPDNVRTNLGDLDDMVTSIRSLGVLQPLLVTPGSSEGRFTIVAGHRRAAAARTAGLLRVPAVVRSGLTGATAVEAMLAESVNRRRLNPIEEAQAYQALLNAGRTQAQLARSTGVNQAIISQRLALLDLTPEEQRQLVDGDLGLVRGYQIGRDRGVDAGTRTSTGRGIPRVRGVKLPHFTVRHPLAKAAKQTCDSADHAAHVRIGPACGQCWEQAIRADEQARMGGAA